jgi:hypothetical protein
VHAAPAHAPIGPYPRHDRIHIGYFSADFRAHALTALTAELFETHDCSTFELTAFSLGPDVQDAARARLEPAFDRFLRVAGESDRAVAALARRQRALSSGRQCRCGAESAPRCCRSRRPRSLESLYGRMYERCRCGLPPEHLA